LDLATPDSEASRGFYHALFGWQYDIGPAEYGGYTTARVGPYASAGIIGSQMGDAPAQAAWSLYFATDAIDADVDRAVSLGASVVYPAGEVGHFGSMAVLVDPTGAGFCLWQSNQHVGSQITNEPGSVAWYELYTPNAKQARDFYTELLGASAEAMPGDMEYYVLSHGDQQLCGIMQIDPAWGPLPTQWVAYFAVADTDAAAALAVAHGGQVHGPIEDTPFGRLAAVTDPHGAMFKLIQPPQ
jgi:hypothetical protein